jgi:hypothetical protein
MKSKTLQADFCCRYGQMSVFLVAVNMVDQERASTTKQLPALLVEWQLGADWSSFEYVKCHAHCHCIILYSCTVINQQM